MMFELKVVSHFAAAHQLKMVDKKCENLHGHNWKVEVCIRGQELNVAGVLVDFGEIKQDVKRIIDQLDHCFLNDLDAFGDHLPPSSENLALFIAQGLRQTFDSTTVYVYSVTTWESHNACATYYPNSA
jgi:6-pyruvoyltetrahydropterin/6-carboxytetrahydropterin synthase